MSLFMNRLNTAHNRYQGDTKRVLTVCSAGILRSPTAAQVLSAEPYNYNTRSVGTSKEYALIHVDTVLLEWADYIVCMEEEHYDYIQEMLENEDIQGKKVFCLDIQDRYPYRSPELIDEIKAKIAEYTDL